jgi:hypothetical protein
MKKLFSKVFPVLAVYFSRFGFLPANLSPLGAYGFFGGQPLLYFASIVAFDFFKGGFYAGFLWTYAGFAIYPLLARFARHLPKRQILLLPAASFSFFLLSNFGVYWSWYEHTWSGLLTCYALALPFYSRTLLGDLLFGYGYLALRHFRHLKQLAFFRRLGYNVL